MAKSNLVLNTDDLRELFGANNVAKILHENNIKYLPGKKKTDVVTTVDALNEAMGIGVNNKREIVIL